MAVANTHQTNGDSQVLETAPTKARLNRHVLKEAKQMRKMRMEFYAQPDLSDFISGNTEIMNTFFNWLDHSRFSIGRIRKVCFDYLRMAGCSQEEKIRLITELDNLISFHSTLLLYSDFIGEKAFYYAAMSEKLEEAG